MTRASVRMIAVVGALVAATGCVSNSTHKKVLDKLAACQGELGDCNTKAAAQADKIKGLEDELVETRKARDDAEARLKEASSTLDASKDELDRLRKQREAAEKRLQAFRELNEKFRALVDTGKLEVVFRNGQMVLKLPAGILFASGKANLSKEGEAALTEVLDVLAQFKDRRFVIAGHTDNLKISTHKFKNNWELSTARALSVVMFMIEAGFAPENLAAAGYGEFDPVASNDTPEGRQLNRRIEIILVPDLSELPNLTAAPAS